MSENEHQPPSTPQLTRRQLRELRNTASTPIITGDPDQVDADASDLGAHSGGTHEGSAGDDLAGERSATEATSSPSAPLARPAEDAVISDIPVFDPSVDLGSPALTRRQARQQEKIRTASVPIITPDAAEADAADRLVVPGDDSADHGNDTDESNNSDESVETDESVDELLSGSSGDGEDASDEDEPIVAEDERTAADVESTVADDGEAAEREPTIVDDEPVSAEDDVDEERHVVSEDLGAALLSGDVVAAPGGDVPASFDQLISRSAAATGAFTAPNALILTQSPDDGPLVAPVTATGEVLITGTFALPENYGSTGVVPGSADGKEVDAVLIDGELPASSSPTPIAASAAISTIKSAEDVIRPPAPEKGSRWMFALAITAGVLAAALVGVLIYALATGV